MTEDKSKEHHIRISHAERRIQELEQELEELKQAKFKMALQLAECEAALIRLDETKPRSIWDVDYSLLKR